jgi:hypothetical protein
VKFRCNDDNHDNKVQNDFKSDFFYACKSKDECKYIKCSTCFENREYSKKDAVTPVACDHLVCDKSTREMQDLLIREQETRKQKMFLDANMLNQPTCHRFTALKHMAESLWTTDYKGENAYKKQGYIYNILAKKAAHNRNISN